MRKWENDKEYELGKALLDSAEEIPGPPVPWHKIIGATLIVIAAIMAS